MRAVQKGFVGRAGRRSALPTPHPARVWRLLTRTVSKTREMPRGGLGSAGRAGPMPFGSGRPYGQGAESLAGKGGDGELGYRAGYSLSS